jgi:hypothetical protein
MPRYIVQRNLGHVTNEQLEAAARNSKKVREERFPDVTWEHSHVVKTKDGLVTYCLYAGPGEARLREHAKAAGLPADAIWELVADVDPAKV